MGWFVYPMDTADTSWEGAQRCPLCRGDLEGRQKYYLIEHAPVDGIPPFLIAQGSHVYMAHAACVWEREERN